MFGFLKNMINKLRGINEEYLYFYILNSEIYGLKDNVRQTLANTIQIDCKKYGKEIVDYDFYTDKQFYESVVVLTTDSLKKPFYKPLIFEIYAFLKKEKDISVFSYKFKLLNCKFYTENKSERIIPILKFKLEC